VFVLAIPGAIGAAELKLKPDTLAAWDEYVNAAEARMQGRLQPGSKFLWIDEEQGRSARVRAGEILVAPFAQNAPKSVPSGLIHDWIAAAFIPHATIGEILAVIRDYGHYPDFYKPNVIEAKTLNLSEDGDRYSMTLLNKSLFQHTALVNEYQSSCVRPSSHQMYGVSRTVRVQEVDDYGRNGQRQMPPDTGSGFIWRLFSVSRLEERDGGVYVELEAIALTRDIPASYRWFVDPIVRRVSKDAMTTSLKQTSDAVRSRVEEASRKGSGCAPNANCIR
jgi:hypothetical protein